MLDPVFPRSQPVDQTLSNCFPYFLLHCRQKSLIDVTRLTKMEKCPHVNSMYMDFVPRPHWMVIFQYRPILVSLVGLATRTYRAVTCSVGETFVLGSRSRARAPLPDNTHSTIFSRCLFLWLLGRKQKRVDCESPSIHSSSRYVRRFDVSAGVGVVSIPIWGSMAFQSVVQENQCPTQTRPGHRTFLPARRGWQPQPPIFFQIGTVDPRGWRQTHPIRLLIPATCACSFALLLPTVTPPKQVCLLPPHPVRRFYRGWPLSNIVAVLLSILIIYGMGNSVFELYNPFSISQSSLVSDLKVSPSKWSCLHCGFAADYLQCRQCHTRENGP